MSGRHAFGIGAHRPIFALALALIMALAVCAAAVLASVHTARTNAMNQEAILLAGPVCFYQDGYPSCVERAGPNALALSGAVSPEDLLTALFAGPTADERDQGYESALPPDTRLVSVQTDGVAIVVRVAFPNGFLNPGSPLLAAQDNQQALETQAFTPSTSEAIVGQIFQTLFPLGYRDLRVEAQDPFAPHRFQPLSTYLPPVAISLKRDEPASPFVLDSQPTVEVQGRPQGALSGKTVYISAGHGWQWNGSNWRTQRPPYPDASTGYFGPIIEDHNNAEVVNQYLIRYLWNAGADVWTVRERDLSSLEQVVDNDASNFLSSGPWSAVVDNGYLVRYLQTTTDLAPTAFATWTTDPLPADGIYGLYIWYASGSNRTSDARYTVHHAGGVTELTVNQQHHGDTWRYIGRYPVQAGERLTVNLSNQSDAPGRAVVADAIRLGGGRFDAGDLASNGGPVETDAPSAPNKPWWEVSAYYHVQRLGLDPDNYAYFNDVIARPVWARWEHANTGEDAIYVSWHTNGYNGHNTTTWGTISYMHSFQPVPGSATLRRLIHGELINDIRVGWDTTWNDLGEASRDLGELRELWDANSANAIPGVLLEIAYHDHVGNTDALKDPRFALLSARAVYQGIAKYFAQDRPLIPEPPTHLVVRNDGPGRILIRWRLSPTDAVGLVGGAARSYRVYTSHDGLGWDNGRDVEGTQLTLTDLPAKELLFVRVTAVNAGGESFPTPVLAARGGLDGVAQILLVDGFDRIDRHGLILENDPVEGINARLFPEQINSYDYVIEHSMAFSLPFDSALNEAVADADLSLGLYNVVDWILGEESTVDKTFDPVEQAALSTYLDGGGALFVSGAEVGWDLVTRGNGPDFYRIYLGADMAGDDADTYVVVPTAEGIFAGLGSVEFRSNYVADYPDQLALRPGSVATLNYLGGDGGIAAIQYDAGGCRRLVYLGFPFETIDQSQRREVMERVLSFLGADGCISLTPQTTITTPISGQALNTMPNLSGSAVGFEPIKSVQVQIISPDGRYWDGRSWIAAAHWLTAVGTTVWQYPLSSEILSGTTALTALDQGEYSIWARAWDEKNLPDATPAFSRFIFDTLSPTVPILLSPADGTTVTVAPTGLFWRGPVGDTGSAIAYDLQIDSQVQTQTATEYLAEGVFGTGVHAWRVQSFDAAGNRSAWTPTWYFYVDGEALPLPVILKNYRSNDPSLCTDIITNGGFERDEGWIINDTALPAAYVTDQFYTGARSVRLGIVPPVPGMGSTSYSSVDQIAALPDGISAALTFWAYPFNENDDIDDLQFFGLYDEAGQWRTLWSQRLNSHSWTFHRVDLTPYLGQLVTLRVGVKNDGDDDTTALYVDDVRVEVCGQ